MDRRRNGRKRFLERRKTELFRGLFHAFVLHGYNGVFRHFGEYGADAYRYRIGNKMASCYRAGRNVPYYGSCNDHDPLYDYFRGYV